MFNKLFSLSLFSLMIFSAPLSAADYVFLLPQGLKVGEISGPGHERISRGLKKRLKPGPANLILNGTVSLERKSRREKEWVSLEKPAGEPYCGDVPDPFTHKLWRKKINPEATVLEGFELERYLGFMTLDWVIVSAHDGELRDQGRTVLEINRTQGGYLAVEGLVPKISSKQSAREFEKCLADDLVRLLVLDLRNMVSAAELESDSDQWSRAAKKLASSGDWEGARKEWEKLLEMNPQYGLALYNLGVYWERNNKQAEALRYYRAAFISDSSLRHRMALTRLTETLSK